VQALQDSGGRVLFGLGDPNALWLPVSDVASDADLAKRIRSEYFSTNSGLVTLALSVRGPEYTTPAVTRQDVGLARELDLKMSIHVGNGARLAANDAPVIVLNAAGLIGPDMLFVHCNQSTDEELRILADAGCPPPSVTPDSEAHFGLGFPAARRLMDIGMRPSLGIDIVTNALGDMFGTFRTLAVLERARQHDAAESMPERLQVSSRDLVEMATVEGARSIWKSDVIGSLTPGKQADVVLLRGDTLHHAPRNNLYGAVALGSHAGDVESVLVGGTFVKRDGVLSADVARVRHLAEQARDDVVRRAHDNGERSVGVSGDWFPEPYVRREG
jgi:cytosine/adenosine deaminase-related metal-dependent hydrolase